jgi:hypothetical protein
MMDLNRDKLPGSPQPADPRAPHRFSEPPALDLRALGPWATGGPSGLGVFSRQVPIVIIVNVHILEAFFVLFMVAPPLVRNVTSSLICMVISILRLFMRVLTIRTLN